MKLKSLALRCDLTDVTFNSEIHVSLSVSAPVEAFVSLWQKQSCVRCGRIVCRSAEQSVTHHSARTAVFLQMSHPRRRGRSLFNVLCLPEMLYSRTLH